jgi:hypothetical protein
MGYNVFYFPSGGLLFFKGPTAKLPVEVLEEEPGCAVETEQKNRKEMNS